MLQKDRRKSFDVPRPRPLPTVGPPPQVNKPAAPPPQVNKPAAPLPRPAVPEPSRQAR